MMHVRLLMIFVILHSILVMVVSQSSSSYSFTTGSDKGIGAPRLVQTASLAPSVSDSPSTDSSATRSIPSVSWTPSNAPSVSSMPLISPSVAPSNAPSISKMSSTIATPSCGKDGGGTRKRSDKAKGSESHAKFSGSRSKSRSNSHKSKKRANSRDLDVSCSGGGSSLNDADKHAGVSEKWTSESASESAATIRTQKLEGQPSGGNALHVDVVCLGLVLLAVRAFAFE